MGTVCVCGVSRGEAKWEVQMKCVECEIKVKLIVQTPLGRRHWHSVRGIKEAVVLWVKHVRGRAGSRACL